MATVIQRGGGLAEAIQASAENLTDLFLRKQQLDLREREVSSQERRRNILNRTGFAEVLANMSTPGATVGEDPMQQAAMGLLVGTENLYADPEQGIVDPRFSSLSLNPLTPNEKVVQMRLDTIERLKNSDDKALRRAGNQLNEALLLEPFEVKSFAELNVLEQSNKLTSRGLSLMSKLTDPNNKEFYDPIRLHQVASVAAGVPVPVQTMVPTPDGGFRELILDDEVASTITSQHYQFVTSEREAQRKEYRRLVDSYVDAASRSGIDVTLDGVQGVLSILHATPEVRAQIAEEHPLVVQAIHGETPEQQAEAMNQIRRQNPRLASLIDLTGSGLTRAEGLWRMSIAQLPNHLQPAAEALMGYYQYVSQVVPKEEVQDLVDAFENGLCDLHKRAGGDCSELIQIRNGMGGLAIGFPWISKEIKLPEGTAAQDATQTGSPSIDESASRIRQAADDLEGGSSPGQVKAQYGLDNDDMKRVNALIQLRGANE